MTKLWWTCSTVLVLLCATEVPAYACSCARIHSFQERLQAAPVVVVGRVASVGEDPPQVKSAPNATIVRPPFMGAGVTLAIASMAKGQVPARQIRVWDLSYGECFNALSGLIIGTSMVVGLWPVADTPATERETWVPASLIPESDYLAAGACGQSVQVLTSDEVVEWTGRKIQ
jgi:hypothetical protein